MSEDNGDHSENFWQQLVKDNRRSRRIYPRVHADISIEVLGVEPQPIKLCSQDISFGGLQIRCDAQTSQRLLYPLTETREFPGSADVNRLDGIKHLKLRMHLVINDKVHKVQCLARIVHCVQIPDALPGLEIAIGFQFLGFKGQGKQLLVKYVEESLIPADA